MQIIAFVQARGSNLYFLRLKRALGRHATNAIQIRKVGDEWDKHIQQTFAYIKFAFKLTICIVENKICLSIKNTNTLYSFSLNGYCIHYIPEIQ